MIAALVLALLSLTSVAKSSESEDKRHRAECLMWSKLENQTLPLQDQGHANCSTNNECTGFNCVGLYQGKDLSFGVRVLPCRSVPGVQIFGYAPQFNSKNFSHIFEHDSEYPVPGNLLNLSLLPGTIHSSGKDVSARLQVHMERNQDGKSITIGLIMKICVEGECLFQKPIINHSELPVPECTNHVEEDVYPKVDSTCSMSDLAACGPNQSCVQQAVGSQVGLCECLPGFVRLQDGTCISKAEDDRRIQQAKESLSSPISTSTSAASDSDEATSSSGTVAAIVISVLIVVVLLGAAAFVILRTRLLPRLRARLTNTPYEDIVIGKQGRSESRQNVIA